MKSIFDDLDEFLALNNGLGVQSEPNIIRKGVALYFKDRTGFGQYIEKKYFELKIKDLSVSKKYFTDFVVDSYINYKKGVENNDVLKSLEKMELSTCHVFLPIYFAQIIKDYIKISEINFVKFQSIAKFALGERLLASNPIVDKLDDDHFKNVPFVDCVVDARDTEFAKEQARIMLLEIINVLNFIVYSHVRGVDAFSANSNYGTRDRSFIFTNKSVKVSTEVHSPLIARTTIDGIQNFLTNDGAVYVNLFSRLTNANRSEMDNRIMNAVNWIGMAIAEKRNSVAFTQAMFGIESLLQYEQKGEVVSKSVVASIAENVAFLLGRNFDERRAFEKRFKTLYGIRSKIAHGKNGDISDHDVLDVISLAKDLVMSFYENPFLKGAKTMKMVLDNIAKLKYSCVDDKGEANKTD